MSKTTIFVSGSRSVKFLPPGALQALDRIMAQGFIIFVGDCLGVDTAVQRYLLAKGYRQVTVCHINARPRHNLGFNSMQVPGTRQTDKDAYMGRTANFGLAIWDVPEPQRTSRESKRRSLTLIQITKLVLSATAQ